MTDDWDHDCSRRPWKKNTKKLELSFSLPRNLFPKSISNSRVFNLEDLPNQPTIVISGQSKIPSGHPCCPKKRVAGSLP